MESPGTRGVANQPFEEFFRAEYPGIVRAMYVVCGSRELAEESTQEAFARVFERWGTLMVENPTGYVYRTAVNVLRAERRRRYAPFAPETRGTEMTEDRLVVEAALLGLSVRERAAVVLVELYGYSSEEAGRWLGVRPGTVRVRLHRARQRLRSTIGVMSDEPID